MVLPRNKAPALHYTKTIHQSTSHPPLQFVWYNLEATDYVPEPGSVADLFRVHTAISDEFYKLRKELDQKIEALVASQPYLTPANLCDMRFAQHGMLMSGTLLSFAAQSRLMTLLNVTTFQRFYLETLAFYDSFTKWEERLLTLVLPRSGPKAADWLNQTYFRLNRTASAVCGPKIVIHGPNRGQIIGPCVASQIG